VSLFAHSVPVCGALFAHSVLVCGALFQRDIDMGYVLSIWDMVYRYCYLPHRYGHPGCRYGIWVDDMGDDSIDTLISHIDTCHSGRHPEHQGRTALPRGGQVLWKMSAERTGAPMPRMNASRFTQRKLSHVEPKSGRLPSP